MYLQPFGRNSALKCELHPNTAKKITKTPFIHKLSSSISSHFVAIQCQNVCCIQKIAKKLTKNTFLVDSRSFMVIDVDKSKKPVTSACYDKQHVRTYLQPFSH